jgi:hypothetical protein
VKLLKNLCKSKVYLVSLGLYLNGDARLRLYFNIFKHTIERAKDSVANIQ